MSLDAFKREYLDIYNPFRLARKELAKLNYIHFKEDRMPNWCVNKLYYKGPRKDIDAFLMFASNQTPEDMLRHRCDGTQPDQLIDFDRFIPYPDTFVKLDKIAEEARLAGKPWNEIPKDGFNQGGYEWKVEHWGTKWNASQPQLVNGHLEFSTAWSPPEPVIEAASKRFPTLTFTLTYFECGAGFKGRSVYKAGELLSKTSGDYRGSLGG